MADTINKPKLQLRAGVTVNGDKSPSPATKLLISHGKPNFTIQKGSPKDQNGEGNPLSPLAQNNNNYNAFKTANGNSNNNNNNNSSSNIVVQSTKFNGVFKPANVAVSEKQPHQQTAATENEAAKVVLRRAKIAFTEPTPPEEEDASVPEFIRRQRRIQERLAKENVLDFENRRSGYFTHVIVSPTSANRQSFIETMSSPAIVPSLEMPSRSPTPSETRKPETLVEEQEVPAQYEEVLSTNAHTTNGHVEEEEVAQAIEEVNRAVAGEDEELEDKTTQEEAVAAPETVALAHAAPVQVEATSEKVETKAEETAAAVSTPEHVEEPITVAATVVSTPEHVEAPIIAAAIAITAAPQIPQTEEKAAPQEIVNVAEPSTLEHAELAAAAPTVVAVEVEASKTEEVIIPKEIQQNGHDVVVASEAAKENGHSETKLAEEFTISHTNGHTDGPRLPSPDPSGALGVNFEPKTVVSFSKDMNEPNKYPDTVKIVSDGGVAASAVDETLQDLAKLKFEIKTDEEDVQVTQVLRTE